MSNTYTPDYWVVIKISGDEPHYRVLASWRGGYATGDYWRMNSGITRFEVEEDSPVYSFYGSSGSVYRCHEGMYGLSSLTYAIFTQLKDKYGDKVELVEEGTDWSKVDWLIK